MTLLQQALEALQSAQGAKLSDGTYLDKDCKITMAITALREAIAQGAVVQQWQTMDSAPKDGTSVLVNVGIGISIGEYLKGFHSWNDGAWWIEGGQTTGVPTHWQPLPAAPKEQA